MPVLTVRTDVASRATGVGAMSKQSKRRPVDWGKKFSRKFMERIVDLAHETNESLGPMSFDDACQRSREHVEGCDVVFAVWPDEHADDIWCARCVKGAGIQGLGMTGALLVESEAVADLMERRIESWRAFERTMSGIRLH
jgi:hypothetical protein